MQFKITALLSTSIHAKNIFNFPSVNSLTKMIKQHKRKNVHGTKQAAKLNLQFYIFASESFQ